MDKTDVPAIPDCGSGEIIICKQQILTTDITVLLSEDS